MIITLKLDKNVKKSGRQSVFFYLSHGKSGEVSQIRKKVYVGLEVSAKQFDLKNFRAKPRHDNQSIINEKLKQLKEIKLTCETKFDAGQYTIQQVVSHLSGKSNIESVDDYIEQEIKVSRSHTTYNDYKNILNCFKKHLGFPKERSVSFNEFSNFTMLTKFKREMVNSGLSNNTINSYFTKIRVVLNDAYLNQFIFEKFTLHKSLKMPKPIKQINTCTVEMFVDGLENCKTIYHVQALGFFLLMFGTRGMYPADIVKIKSTDLRDSSNFSDEFGLMNDDFLKNGINKLIDKGENFLVHTRSKNRSRSNVPMVIRIDQTIHKLFIWLKLSVILTHKNRPEILGAFDDNLNILDYDTDTDIHANIWNSWSKHCSRLLKGVRFMDARKSFNTQALKLKISSDIRQVLLGHKNLTMLQYYDDLSVIEDEVNDAHKDILKAFEFEALVELVVSKFNEIDDRISIMLPPYNQYL